MKKIAILGCENSHAHAFIRLIQGKKEFSDIEVFGVYSDDRGAADKLHDAFGVPVLDNYTDAVGKIDGVVITARHGDNHYKYAKPYIDAGIPMFIDKPITISEDEAIEFMRVLKSKGIPVSGGSSLKQDTVVRQLKREALDNLGGKTLGGYVRAPYSAENEYGGFYFYSPHLVEMACEIFGCFPRSVVAKQNGGQIHVIFRYEDYDAVGLFCNGNYIYYALRMTEKGASGGIIESASEDWYYREFKEFYDLFEIGAAKTNYKEFISSVMIMNAITRSLASGKEESVREIEL